jgi:hypothetical protein
MHYLRLNMYFGFKVLGLFLIESTIFQGETLKTVREKVI